MYRKLAYVFAMSLVCGLSVAQAADWDRAVYWDARCRTGWADNASSIIVRDGLVAAGYALLDADQLKTWMDGHIADKALSVVVLARDNVPNTVVETTDATCTLRKYLDAGGKIVFYADIPFWDIAKTDGTWTNPQTAAGDAILGIGTNLVWDSNNQVTITGAGAAWGLTATWASLRATPSDKVDKVLATDNAGNAAAWVKHFVPGDWYRGFVRLFDRPGYPPVEDIIRAAEYMGLEAYAPDPADGALDVLMPIFRWTASGVAVMQDVYFGTNPNPGAAELKTKTPAAASIYIQAALEAGVTYYWRVDSIDAIGTVYPGKVWSFTVMPLTAHSPNPPDGAKYRPTNLTVSWTAGQAALSHKVYGSENQAAVAAADAGALLIEQAETSLDASALLQPGKTYYWRVDTIDLANNLHAGPVWTFSTYDPAGGAVAEYWDNRYLAGQPKVVKNVATIDFDWGGATTRGTNSPDVNIPVDNFSCRWSAELNVPVTGTYKLYEASDDGSRLYLNGQQIASGWRDRGTTEDASAELELTAGERYLVVMEMYENGGGATAFLRWSGPGIAKEIIPQGALQIPEMAVGPIPINGATGVAGTTSLTWIAGKTAVKHDVYLGTDPNLVAAGDASTLQGRVAETSFTPAAPLLWDTTYYWKVDEVRADETVVLGIVSKFTVANRSIVDDFESYDLVPAAPATAPIGWWKLDGNLTDSSGKGHDGKIVGDGVTFVTDPIMGTVLSLPGGDNQFVEIGAVGLSGKMPTTISVWAKGYHKSIPDWSLVFGFTGKADGTGGNGSHFNIDSIGGPGGVGAHVWGWEETIFTDDQSMEWRHYAMTYDGTTIRYYGDGVPFDTDPGKSNVRDLSARGDRVHIGKRVTQASSFAGLVSDARVYDYVLSPAEVASLAGASTLLSDVWKDSGGAVSSLDTDFVHGGTRALTVTYDGAGEVSRVPPYADLGRGPAKTLSLWFYGDSTSTATEVYVKLNDTKVPLEVDPKLGWWQLAVVDVTSLDLQNVTSFGIGVAGGKGILTVDDIVLNAEGVAPVAPVEVWLEAEKADVLGAKLRLYDDATASGGQYIGTNNGDGDSNSKAPDPNWIATYKFTAPAGVYKVMLRGKTDSDSFWVRIPTATSQTHEHPAQAGTGWVRFNGMRAGATMHWDEVHSDDHSRAIVNWTLPAGDHTLEIAKREDGTWLDAILITSGLGTSEAKLDMSLMPLNVPLAVPLGSPIIIDVVRAGGQSGNRAPVGAFDANTAPLPTQAGGLKDGNLIYSDRTYTWVTSPAELVGSEYVRTFNNDKATGEKEVTYTVTTIRKATVWITVDDRIPAEWNAGGAVTSAQAAVDYVTAAFAAAGTFVDTGLDLFTGGDSDRKMSVYAAELPAGTYVFGPLWSNKNFYTIGAK